MLINITNFAKERNVEPQAVSKYLARHTELEELTSLNGKERLIDTDNELFKQLEKAYPLPEPVTVLNGVPEKEYIQLLERLNEKSEYVSALQQKLLEMANEISEMKIKQIEAEQLQLRLEQREEEIESLQAEKKKMQNQIKNKSDDYERIFQNYNDAVEKSNRLEKDLERLENRTFFSAAI